jgi:RNA-directed DNA polymerase
MPSTSTRTGATGTSVCAADATRRRPLGTPACADQIVQRAVAMRREAIYAQDFHDGSYGFRPGRSPQDALHELRERCRREGIGGIGEADVSGYFDSINRTQLQEVVRQRVNDGRIRRLMGKWLRAGVMEDGGLTQPEPGVVPGGVIAPRLAHIFLHHGLDAWVEREVRPRLKGRSFLPRFADDVVIGGELATDARRSMAVLPKRFARFGLTLPPTKTARMPFRQPDRHEASDPGTGTCECLGLTHDWAQSRRGFGVSKRRTARQRLRRTKKSLWRWCRAHRQAPLNDQYRMLCLKLRGHFHYYGVRGHCRLREEVGRYAEKAWRYWRSRHRSKSAIGGEKCQQLLETDSLPTPKIVHHI